MFEGLRDEDVRDLDPDDLVDFVKRAGWVFQEHHGPATFYRTKAGMEVLLPRVRHSKFYSQRVRELLEAIVDDLGIEESSVYNDVRYARCDITRLKAVSSRVNDTLPPADYQSLVNGGTDIWEDAVKRTLGSRVDQRHYWDAAGFGHTERSSFVFTLCSPPVLHRGQFPLTREGQALTAARKVTVRLRESIRATRSALTAFQQGDDYAFEKVESDLVTTATCEGLSKAIKPFESVTCFVNEVGLPGVALTPPTSVAFRGADAGPLKIAANDLDDTKLDEPRDDAVSGYIMKCERERKDEEGVVTIKTLMEDRNGQQTVRISLGPEDYDRATRMHVAKVEVEAKGMLSQDTKTTWSLQNARIRRRPSANWDEGQGSTD